MPVEILASSDLEIGVRVRLTKMCVWPEVMSGKDGFDGSSRLSLELSMVGAFPCLPYAFL